MLRLSNKRQILAIVSIGPELDMGVGDQLIRQSAQLSHVY